MPDSAAAPMASSAVPTPAEPTSALPRSKTSTNAPASTSTANNATHDAPAPPTAHDRSAHQQAETFLRTASNPDFKHPDHVIPRRNYSGFTDLIIVCCHAIYLPSAETSNFPLHSPLDERNWLLAPFQRSNATTGKPGEHETFLLHAQAGVNALTISPDNYDLETNLLVFSGGATQKPKTDMTEARSYYHAALAAELSAGNLGGGRTHGLFTRGRILLEEHATDTLQNVLFSILLFRRTVGTYPKKIRVVTHAFKSKRVLELHAPALRWPEERIIVQGIDPVMGVRELDEALEGEEAEGYAAWDEDAFGVGERLRSKRVKRGWDEGVVDEMMEGVEESVKGIFKGEVRERLPWEDAEAEEKV
jgi:hypothetical protein